jgi:hypothetical protein
MLGHRRQPKQNHLPASTKISHGRRFCLPASFVHHGIPGANNFHFRHLQPSFLDA